MSSFLRFQDVRKILNYIHVYFKGRKTEFDNLKAANNKQIKSKNISKNQL